MSGELMRGPDMQEDPPPPRVDRSPSGVTFGVGVRSEARAAGQSVDTVIRAAAAWAALFAAGSFYLALGGRYGATTVAPAIADRLLRDDPDMIRALWLTGCLKVTLAGFLLASVRLGITARLRVWSGWIVQGIGVLLALWGVAEGVVGLLVSTAVLAPPDGWGDGAAATFYAALWGPFWLLGGILYVLAGRRVTKAGMRRVRDSA